MNKNKWIAHARIQPCNKRNLLCFIFDGGSAGYFAPWKYRLFDDINLIPILYPAREKRKNEPMHKNMKMFIEDLVTSLAEIFQGDYAFFGYCSGAVLAYEAATLASRLYGTQPQYGMVVSSQAPQYLRDTVPVITAENQETLFFNHMMGLPFMTEKVMHDPVFLNYYKPLFLADYGLLHTYAYHKQNPLACDLDVIYCPDDPQVEKEKVVQWENLTTGATRVIEKDGGHFLVDQQADYIFSVLNGRLSKTQASVQPIKLAPAQGAPNATKTEEKLMKIYHQVFEQTQFFPSDHFFQKGGDSLKAVQIVNAVKTEFGIDVNISDIFRHAQLSDFAAFVAETVDWQVDDSDLEQGEI